MGCWNGTCMISNLPIISGDKIKLVLLKPNYGFKELNQSGGYVYSNDIFKPSYLPISGEYNDYGGIENIEEDWNYALIEEALKTFFGKKIIVDDKEMTEYGLSDIIEGIERNDLRYFGVDPDDIKKKTLAKSACKTYDKSGWCSKKAKEEWKELLDLDVTPKERKYHGSFVIIRQDIWDHIIKTYIGEFWNPDEKEYDKGNYYVTAKEWCKHTFNNAIKIKKVKGFNFSFSRLFGDETTNRHIYNTFFEKLKKKEKEKVFNPWSELYIINSFVQYARKGWMVQPGRGSQDSSWDTHKILAEKIINICEKNLKEEN